MSFRAATALFGHLGIEWDLTAITSQEAEDLAGVIAYYKQVRPLLHSGRVVRVDHPDPAVAIHGVVAQDRTEAVFAYVQLASSPTEVPPPVRAERLGARTPVSRRAGAARRRPERPGDRLASLGGRGIVLTGEVLMRVGLQMPVLHPEQAMILHLAEV